MYTKDVMKYYLYLGTWIVWSKWCNRPDIYRTSISVRIIFLSVLRDEYFGQKWKVSQCKEKPRNINDGGIKSLF